MLSSSVSLRSHSWVERGRRRETTGWNDEQRANAAVNQHCCNTLLRSWFHKWSGRAARLCYRQWPSLVVRVKLKRTLDVCLLQRTEHRISDQEKMDFYQQNGLKAATSVWHFQLKTVPDVWWHSNSAKYADYQRLNWKEAGFTVCWLKAWTCSPAWHTRAFFHPASAQEHSVMTSYIPVITHVLSLVWTAAFAGLSGSRILWDHDCFVFPRLHLPLGLWTLLPFPTGTPERSRTPAAPEAYTTASSLYSIWQQPNNQSTAVIQVQLLLPLINSVWMMGTWSSAAKTDPNVSSYRVTNPAGGIKNM